MRPSFEFLLGLLDERDPAYVAQEDFAGEHGPALDLWLRAGLIANAPGVNPAPGCPHCGKGTPYRLGARLVCDCCRSEVAPEDNLLWRLDLQALLSFVAQQWHLSGGVRRVDATLWQLGTLEGGGVPHECFFRRLGPLTEAGISRLAAFRRVIVLSGRALVQAEDAHVRLTLLELLRPGETLSLADTAPFLGAGGAVRFDPTTGALWCGGTLVGEVPAGSKEAYFLECLARSLDRCVPYADLKREVQDLAGSRESRDEATFCHRLKSRIKKRFIPSIDRFVVPSSKGEGYRLRGRGEP